MAKITWSERSRKDLEEITEYIASDKPVAALLNSERIYEAAGRIQQFPKSGRVVPEAPMFREIIHGSYRIIYRILSEDSIEIVTIHHSARLLLLD